MINNAKVGRMVVEQFSYMQGSLNALEEHLEDVELNVSKIGFEAGKLHKEFELLITLLDIKLPT
jgi:hypothetical protein